MAHCKHGWDLVPAWTIALGLLAGAANTGCAAGVADSPGAEAGGTGGSGGAPGTVTHPPAPGSDTSAEDGLALLAEFRSLAGLSPPQVDDAMSAGCAAHLDYLVWESTTGGKGTCFLSHTEDDHDNPYYAPEHEAAGKDSVIACAVGSDGRQTLAQAVDVWMNSLYHRLPLLHPGLTKIGYASKDGYNCINYRSGTDETVVVTPLTPVLWPPDGLADVPRSFVGHEVPCPTKVADPMASTGVDCAASGFIVTASWFGLGGWTAPFGHADRSGVRLVDEDTGSEIPLLTWYADGLEGHDPVPRAVAESVALVPAASLPFKKTLRAEIDVVLNEEPVHVTWRFMTGVRAK